MLMILAMKFIEILVKIQIFKEKNVSTTTRNEDGNIFVKNISISSFPHNV